MITFQQMAANDVSHDWSHIERVWKTAKTIAVSENIQDVEAVELGALLHDIADWKYSGRCIHRHHPSS